MPTSSKVNPWSRFGAKLRVLRGTRLTRDIAVDLGITSQAYNHWERGRWLPALCHWQALCRVLGDAELPTTTRRITAEQEDELWEALRQDHLAGAGASRRGGRRARPGA